MDDNCIIEKIHAENILLTDTISALEISMDKAATIVQTITEDYFEQYRGIQRCDDIQEARKNSQSIVYNFPTYATYAEIMADIIYDARTTVESARRLQEELRTVSS